MFNVHHWDLSKLRSHIVITIVSGKFIMLNKNYKAGSAIGH